MKNNTKVVLLVLLVGFLSLIGQASNANEIAIVPSSPLTGPILNKPGYPSWQGEYAAYDTRENLAFPGNGLAQPAVAKDVHTLYPGIHQPILQMMAFMVTELVGLPAVKTAGLKLTSGRP